MSRVLLLTLALLSLSVTVRVTAQATCGNNGRCVAATQCPYWATKTSCKWQSTQCAAVTSVAAGLADSDSLPLCHLTPLSPPPAAATCTGGEKTQASKREKSMLEHSFATCALTVICLSVSVLLSPCCVRRRVLRESNMHFRFRSWLVPGHFLHDLLERSSRERPLPRSERRALLPPCSSSRAVRVRRELGTVHRRVHLHDGKDSGGTVSGGKQHQMLPPIGERPAALLRAGTGGPVRRIGLVRQRQQRQRRVRRGGYGMLPPDGCSSGRRSVV